MPYTFRFFFDAGSGICLWAADEQTRQEFGYPVEHWNLPLSENTKRWLTYLIAWYDVSLNWEDPGASDDVWSPEESARFRAAVKRGLGLLQQELPDSQFTIVDET